MPAAVGGAPKKVPPIMRLVFDRGGASKAQLKSRLNILATTRHCLSCDQIVQKMEGGFWKLVADEHENATKHKGQWTFPICKLKPLVGEERRKQRISRSEKVAKEKSRIKERLQKMESEK